MNQADIEVKCGNCGYRHPVISAHQKGTLFISSIIHSCDEKRALFDDEIFEKDGIDIDTIVVKEKERKYSFYALKDRHEARKAEAREHEKHCKYTCQAFHRLYGRVSELEEMIREINKGSL